VRIAEKSTINPVITFSAAYSLNVRLLLLRLFFYFRMKNYVTENWAELVVVTGMKNYFAPDIQVVEILNDCISGSENVKVLCRHTFHDTSESFDDTLVCCGS
jgi:hypothetical protein